MCRLYKKTINCTTPIVFHYLPSFCRLAQNLSVRLVASLFCLCLKRRSYPIAHLSLKGIIGGLDSLLAGMMLSPGNSNDTGPPDMTDESEKDIG